MAEFLILAKNRTNYSIPIKAKSNCKYVCLFDMYLNKYDYIMAYWQVLSFLSCQFEFHRFQCIKHIVITKDMVNSQQKQYANANTYNICTLTKIYFFL